MVQGDHSIEKAAETSAKVLSAFFRVMQLYNVYLEGIVLKTSMSLPGKKAANCEAVRPQDIAKATVLAFSRTVPPAVPGVAFLSGGQTEEQVRNDRQNSNLRYTYSGFSWNKIVERNFVYELGSTFNKLAL